jgi:clan AA aspartic protease (TIGR02281 family)
MCGEVSRKGRFPMLFRRCISFFALLLIILLSDSSALIKPATLPTSPIFNTSRLLEVKVVPQVDNTYAVPVTLNGKQASFLVDTGASYTVISPRLARKLGFSTRNQSYSVPVTTINGVVYAPVVTIKQFTLGKLTFQNVSAVIADLGGSSNISGLLGMNFFVGRTLVLTPHHLFIGRK